MYKNIRILVIGGKNETDDSVSGLLNRNGYTLDYLQDSEEVTKKIRLKKYDIILLDINMSGTKGIDVFKSILEVDKNIITIIITATDSIEVAIQKVKNGAYGYITKPVDIEYLTLLINNALMEKQKTVQNDRLKKRIRDLSYLTRNLIKKNESGYGKPIDSQYFLSTDSISINNTAVNVQAQEMAAMKPPVTNQPSKSTPHHQPFHPNGTSTIPAPGSLAESEKNHIIFILNKNNWNISRSAEILGIDRVTLYNKIEKYGLRK